MVKTKTKHHQKRYLQIGFAVVFVISFAVIAVERSRLENAPDREAKQLPLAEYVAGDSIEPGAGIQDYRAIVIESLLVINQEIESASLGQPGENDVIRNTYRALLAAPVPHMYLSLHADLVGLARESAKGRLANTALLAQKRAALYTAYPWLP
ncbi:MAG: hypothetical protein U1C18_01145 [Patescibacteria group bacterium]|nr:hypothetical protein [Patescibacteria group bacterium]